MNDPAKERASYYRRRAADARQKAEMMADPEARAALEQTAGLWDFVASQAEGAAVARASFRTARLIKFTRRRERGVRGPA